MGIVLLALRRPYTFVVMAVLILLLGVAAIRQTPTDILPNIDIPVVSVIWTYKGLPTQEMAQRITTYSEYAISANVNDIRTMESQTMNGISVTKIYFHPTVHIDAAVAQITAVCQAIRGIMPTGVQPPIVLQFSASSVPILQMALSSKTLSESQIYDYGLYRIRQQLAVVQGATLPTPYGGKSRQIMVDIDPQALHATGLSARDISDAINAQNLTLPTGSARIGNQDYPVSLNSSPLTAEQFNDLPIKQVNGAMIYMRDVAQVHDGFAVQTNIVRLNGTRGALLTVLKNGNASTIDIVNQIKALMPAIRAAAPPGLKIELLSDQSIFVRAAMSGVVKECLIAACLTATLILLFLSSWRSTLIVATSIPLAILTAIALLNFLGETLNVMTLGGLALAVGMLVDDATVEIENVHRNLAMGKSLQRAILEGAQQIVMPTFVATLTICIVFVSVVFLTGPPRYLFVPMAMAVVFAMAASYLLSRTLVPVMIRYLLPREAKAHQSGHEPTNGFNRAFERLRQGYTEALASALRRRPVVFGLFGALAISGALLLPQVGRDFFPTVDAGQLRLHVHAPAGLRVEQTERLFSAVEAEIRAAVPEGEVGQILDNIGIPGFTYNLAFGDSVTTGTADGEILISLQEDRHLSTAEAMRAIRQRLRARFPDTTFYFQSADIVSQILNFGLAAPIDIRVMGYSPANYETARAIAAEVAHVRGAADVHLQQVTAVPELHLEIDRTRTAQLGLTQNDVARDVLISLSGSGAIEPNYWVDPTMGISYPVAVQTPIHRITDTQAITNTSIGVGGQTEPALLSNLAHVERRTSPEVVTHSNIQPTYDVYANVAGRDLGAVSGEIEAIVAKHRATLPPGNVIEVQGQVESMNSAFVRLGLGLAFAALLVYLLMVVNFQSWVDPFIIIMALPGALIGIIWMLYATQTTFNVPSLMGAIMSVGVATANSILLVTFANDLRREGLDAMTAALEAGRTRLRPVLMTALAMIIGMLPMALGLGEGGEQNAPLGRAVIGGLSMATVTTLFVVPVVYTLLRRRKPLEIVIDPNNPDGLESSEGSAEGLEDAEFGR
jgi:multidrug efflux pump subunit AcrB